MGLRRAALIAARRPARVRRRGDPILPPDAMTEESAVPSIWNLDIRARADNRVFVSGMGLESEWSADLRMQGTTATPAIVGEVDYLHLESASLLDANDGWLRERFTELGVIQFEDWADTGEEYEMFQLAEGETITLDLAMSPTATQLSAVTVVATQGVSALNCLTIMSLVAGAMMMPVGRLAIIRTFPACAYVAPITWTLNRIGCTAYSPGCISLRPSMRPSTSSWPHAAGRCSSSRAGSPSSRPRARSRSPASSGSGGSEPRHAPRTGTEDADLVTHRFDLTSAGVWWAGAW